MFIVSSVLCSYLGQLKCHSRTSLFSKYSCVMLSRKPLRWCWITSTLTELTPLRRVSVKMSTINSLMAAQCNEIIVVHLLYGDGSSKSEYITFSVKWGGCDELSGYILCLYPESILLGWCPVQTPYAGYNSGIMSGVHTCSYACTCLCDCLCVLLQIVLKMLRGLLSLCGLWVDSRGQLWTGIEDGSSTY